MALKVEIVIYNLLGQKVRTLVDSEQPLGYHEVRWDARNDRGIPVADGIYIYQMRTANKTLSRKMILIR